MLIGTHALTVKRGVSAAVLRVSLGAIMLLFYGLHFQKFAFFWGPSGQIPWAIYARSASSSIDLFRYSSNVTYAEGVFTFSILAALCFTLGIAPRLSSFAFLITTHSVFDRDRFMRDGGEQLLVALVVYLCFADTSGHFVLLREGRFVPSHIRRLCQGPLGALHNAAMFVISCQIALVYFWASFYKISGISWRNGSALFFVLSSDRYTLPMVAHIVLTSPLLLSVLAYASVIFQMAFVFLMWNQKLKLRLVGMMIGMHICIAIVLGLVSFSLIMIAADFALLGDEEWFVLRQLYLAACRRLRVATGIVGTPGCGARW